MPHPTPPTPGRPRDDQRRLELRRQAADVLVARESCEVSLRELAGALGASSRMLVHHFGSRDGLIGAASEEARSRLLERVRTQLDQAAPSDLVGLVETLRAIITDPRNRPLFRLFDEINALSQTQPERFPGFGRASVHDWLPQFTHLLSSSASSPAAARAQATLALAVVRGLTLDLNATGETERVDDAFASFAALASQVEAHD